MRHKIASKQHNSKKCFICGLKNSSGLKASFFETEGNELIARFMPTEDHQSYPGRLHGGIASAILDETIGRAISIGNAEQIWGITVELSVQFKKPIPLNNEIKVIGRITNQNSRFFEGTGEIVLENGEIAVVAKGRYMKAPLSKIADFDPEENDWRVVENENDPKFIEL
ncbi:MAG TPA: PaaI family thioesterase [Desulfuromonadales bacterium]|nr:PaaI family thioesterase [Desulfuromonadales bacterium]